MSQSTEYRRKNVGFWSTSIRAGNLHPECDLELGLEVSGFYFPHRKSRKNKPHLIGLGDQSYIYKLRGMHTIKSSTMIIFKTESISRCDTLKKKSVTHVGNHIHKHQTSTEICISHYALGWSVAVFLHNSQDLRWEVIPGHEQNVIFKNLAEFGYSYACIIILKDRVFWRS